MAKLALCRYWLLFDYLPLFNFFTGGEKAFANKGLFYTQNPNNYPSVKEQISQATPNAT